MEENKHYEDTWSDFINYLSLYPKTTLKAFLNEKDIDYKDMQKWMRKKGYTILKARKEIIFKPSEQPKEANNEKLSPTEKEHIDLSNFVFPETEQETIKNIDLTFPNGIQANLKNEGTETIVKLIKLYGKGLNKISFKNAIKYLGFPVIQFMQGEKKINFILDTGSNDCIIDSNCLGNIEYTLSNKVYGHGGLEGSMTKVRSCMIKTTYKGIDYTGEYLIRDMSAVFGSITEQTKINIHGLLGVNFFKQFKYVLDFDELIAYSKE